MVFRGYLSSDLTSVVWFYVDGRKTKKHANIQAKLLIGQGKPNKTFCRSQWRINKKLVHNSVPRNTKKIHEICGNDLRVFALRNYSEGNKINKPISGLAGISEVQVLGWKIVLKISQLPSKLHFPANCSFCRTIFQPWALSSNVPAPKGVYLLNILDYLFPCENKKKRRNHSVVVVIVKFSSEIDSVYKSREVLFQKSRQLFSKKREDYYQLTQSMTSCYFRPSIISRVCLLSAIVKSTLVDFLAGIARPRNGYIQLFQVRFPTKCPATLGILWSHDKPTSNCVLRWFFSDLYQLSSFAVLPYPSLAALFSPLLWSVPS